MGFPDEDADVQGERDYIHATPLATLCQTDAIVVQSLSKSFAGFRAVDSLTFRVPRVSVDVCCGASRPPSCYSPKPPKFIQTMTA